MSDVLLNVFQPWPKIARYYRDITITEKIDGTNAQIAITNDGEIYAGSRKQWIALYGDDYLATIVDAQEETA